MYIAQNKNFTYYTNIIRRIYIYYISIYYLLTPNDASNYWYHDHYTNKLEHYVMPPFHMKQRHKQLPQAMQI